MRRLFCFESLTSMLLISLEGFSPAAISCYGSSWNRTESLDRIAATGVTWDRVIANTSDPLEQISRWLSRDVAAFENMTLVTDDERLSGLDMIDNVGEFILLSAREPGIASSIDETMLASMAAVAAEQLEVDDHVWLHSRFLTRCWDAPRELFPIEHLDDWDNEPLETAELLDEEMTQGLQGSIIEQAVPEILQQWQPPNFIIGERDDPDWIMAWMRTYGCQIRLIDAIVGLLTELVIDLKRGPIVVVGTSGFALGQNKSIGHQTGPLRSCHLHVPLLTSSFDPQQPGGAGMRDRRVIGLDVVTNHFNHPSAKKPVVDVENWARDTHPDPVITSNGKRPVAINTHAWFYAIPEATSASESAIESGNLFLKPDDATDANDVSRIRNDVVDEMVTLLSSPS